MCHRKDTVLGIMAQREHPFNIPTLISLCPQVTTSLLSFDNSEYSLTFLIISSLQILFTILSISSTKMLFQIPIVIRHINDIYRISFLPFPKACNSDTDREREREEGEPPLLKCYKTSNVLHNGILINLFYRSFQTDTFMFKESWKAKLS